MEELGDLPSDDPVLEGKEPVHRVIAHIKEECRETDQDGKWYGMVIMQICLLIVEAHAEERHCDICHDKQTDQSD